MSWRPFRHRRDSDGAWSEQSQQSEEPDPYPLPIRDVGPERYIPEPTPGIPLRWRLAMAATVTLNGGLLLALAAIAWYAAEHR